EVAEPLSGTPLRTVIPPVLGFVRLPEGGRAAVTQAPVGRPLLLDELSASPALARSLGVVLARIHTVPRYAGEAAGVESFTAEALHQQLRERIDRVHGGGHLSAPVAPGVEPLLADPALWDFAPQVVHGARAEESLFHAQAQSRGVRDWCSAMVADAATGLAWLSSALEPELFDELYGA